MTSDDWQSSDMPEHTPDKRFLQVSLLAITVMTIVCFFPLLYYFFAQDDFSLIHLAVTQPGSTIKSFFTEANDQFRPLTKVAYFAIMSRIHGLKAMPFHISSLYVHVLNVLIMFVLFRRMGVNLAAALIAVALFGMNLAFFHAIAWVSCIQQLLALTFMLGAMVYGVDFLRSEKRSHLWMSGGLYALALMSMEQSYALPVILLLIAVMRIVPGINAMSVRDAVIRLWPHFTLFGLFTILMLFVKGLPEAGTYQFSFGKNVAVNLSLYSGRLYVFWLILPAIVTSDHITWSAGHVVLALLIIYQLWRRRYRPVLFSLAFVLLTLLPALFLTHHTYFFHTYIPSFGAMYLLALAVSDLFGLPFLERHRVRNIAVGAIIVVVFLLSTVFVRLNEKAVMPGTKYYRNSFVLRRALAAAQAYHDLRTKSGDMTRVRDVYMVYGREEGRSEAKWNRDNMVTALAHGDAVKVFYGRPDLRVHMLLPDDPQVPVNTETARVFYYGDFGACFTHEEFLRMPVPLTPEK